MKTRTYARVVLLIPLLAWVILLLVELLINVAIPVDLRLDGPYTVLGFLEISILFYVMGILFWFLPYLVLCIALLLISFKSRLEVLKYLYILSPFAMAMLVMLEVTFISLPVGGMAVPSPELVPNFIYYVGVNLLFGILALVFGYIFVGLGFGGYKLLQHFGLIKDNAKFTSEVLPVNSLAAGRELQ